jgi:hypothetical protein
MTVSTSVYKAGPYAGSGTTGPFTVTFRFLANSHLRVIKTSTTGSETTLNLGVDYSVTGAGGASGTVTLTSPLLTGEKLTIVRNVPLTQETDYVFDDSFPAESHELALDKLTMITQQLAEEVDRAVKVLPSSTDDPDALIASIKTSEQNAAASAASAAASYDQFDDRYLGAKTSNPTLDNDGNALQVGAEYWNSVSNERRTWTGSAWVSSITVVPDNSVTTGKIQDTQVTYNKLGSDVTPILTGRNKIINGKMDISERGGSFPAIAANAYFLDRWAIGIGGSTSAVLTASQQTDAPTNNEFLQSLRLAVTTADTSIASTEFVSIRQRVEGYNVRDLIGRTFTLSFWVRSSKTGIHCVSLQNSGVDRSYVAEYTITTANTWEQKTITVSGGLITAGTWNWTAGIGLAVEWALAAGTSFHTTAGAWQTGNFRATANQVNCLDSTSNIFAITGIQLEVGSVATPFEHRPFGAELALCQRYYVRYATNNMVLGNGHLNSATQYDVVGTFPVTMRAAPTATALNIGSIQVKLPGGSAQSITNVTAFISSTIGYRVFGDMPSFGSVGQGCYLFSNADGRGFEFSSEL